MGRLWDGGVGKEEKEELEVPLSSANQQSGSAHKAWRGWLIKWESSHIHHRDCSPPFFL